MVCLDDKHRMKVGEPGFPVAAAKRGKVVLVKVGASFEVGDHDFIKFSLVPSVTLVSTIPSVISGSQHRGSAYFALKKGL